MLQTDMAASRDSLSSPTASVSCLDAWDHLHVPIVCTGILRLDFQIDYEPDIL